MLTMCAALAQMVPAQTKAAPKAAAPKATAPKAATPTTKAAPKAAAKSAGMDLLKPETLNGKPPAIFVMRLETTKGNIDIRVVRAWAPNGVARIYNLVRAGYYNNNYFFRVLGFMAQAGINPDPRVNAIWSEKTLFDDRVVQSNIRGAVTMAAGGSPNSRSTQFFINKKDANTYLDQLKFAVFGEVVEGMDVVDQLYSGYGEPPIQGQLQEQGNPFIERNYLRMDKIIKASIIAVPEP